VNVNVTLICRFDQLKDIISKKIDFDQDGHYLKTNCVVKISISRRVRRKMMRLIR